MGWLHVDQNGKGIDLNALNIESLNYDLINSIIKDSSVLNEFFGKSFANYDQLTNKNKWILIGY